jgi:hypothetical protein
MSNRKTKLVVIETAGRDQGKTFRIEEMDAWSGESWATRAFHEITRAGGKAEGYVPGAGWEALAFAGFEAFGKLDLAVAKPLWDELIGCVKRVEDPGRPDVNRPLVSSDCDEIATIVQLKVEAFSIHANFSKAVNDQRSTTASTTLQEPSSPNTSTSPPSSGPLFHQARRRSRNSQPR